MSTKPHPNQRTLRGPSIGFSVLVATFALNLLALSLPLVVLQIFDRVIPFQATETLFFFFVGLCVVATLEFILKTARTVLLGSAGKAFEIQLSQQFMDSALNADLETFSETTPASHLDHFGAIAQLRAHYAGQGRILSIDLPFTAIFILMIWLIGGWLVLVPIGCILLLLTFRASLQTTQSSIFNERRILDSRRYSFLAEALSQIRTLKANTMEPQILRRYELLQDQTTEISHRIIKFSGLSQSFGALFAQFAVAAMGLVGSYLVIIGKIGVAELAACMLLNGRTVQPMLKALGLWVQSENLAAAKLKFENVRSVKRRPDVPNYSSKLIGQITLENTGLKHKTTGEYLFKNLNVSVAPGECLLVTGIGGAGKTSCLKLLLGELSPSEGSVRIDGNAAHDFLETRGHGGIGYVDHTSVVFAGTVLENISAFGDGETIKYALELSVHLGIEKFIHRLPLGYNTQVLSSPALTNNRAAMQGISLVRAFALRPKILLVNNVGAAMDDKAKAAFEKFALSAKGDTTLVIAEDLNCFSKIADKFLNLSSQNGAMIAAFEADAKADKMENTPLLLKNAVAG